MTSSSNRSPLRIGSASRLRICKALNHEGGRIEISLAPFGRFRVSLDLEGDFFVWATCDLAYGARDHLCSGRVRVARLGDWPALWTHLVRVYDDLARVAMSLKS